jgi:hypothetical protein
MFFDNEVVYRGEAVRRLHSGMDVNTYFGFPESRGSPTCIQGSVRLLQFRQDDLLCLFDPIVLPPRILEVPELVTRVQD